MVSNKMMKFNKVKDPFALESFRAKLADESNLKDLKKTYVAGLPLIPNKNTPDLWDLLNRSHQTSKSENPMEWDKLQNVVRIINNEPNGTKKIINIGFGSGNLEGQIYGKVKSFNWFGVDISGESVKTARRKFPGYTFNIGNISDLPFSDGYFDILIALEILEHISSTTVLECLNEAKRILKNNGLMIVSVPLNEGLKQMLKSGLNPNAHVRVYTPKLIEAELNLCGFEIEDKHLYYAFRKNYSIKKIISSIFPKIRNPNGILLKARKK